jgi:hypothetical protein
MQTKGDFGVVLYWILWMTWQNNEIHTHLNATSSQREVSLVQKYWEVHCTLSSTTNTKLHQRECYSSALFE